MPHARRVKHTVTRATVRAGATAVTSSSAPDNEQRITNNGAQRASGLVRANNRPTNIVEFEDSVVGFFLDAADMLGVPKSVAAIYGICFASPEPLSFSDINERLEISSGSISQGLRVLREVGALKIAEHEKLTRGHADALTSESHPAAEISSRSDAGNESISASQFVSISASQRATARYEPDLELRNLVLHWIEKRLQGQLSSGRSRLQQIITSIPKNPDTTTAGETLQLRFESLQTWHDKANSLLPIAKTFLRLT